MSEAERTEADAEQIRQELLSELEDSLEDGWEEEYAPGTLGLHELLDRTFIAGDMIEDMLLSHPACVLNAEWFALAHQAAEALHALYQRVEAAEAEEDPEGLTGEI